MSGPAAPGGGEIGRLKSFLDRFLATFDITPRLRHDPIQFPRRYDDPADAEVAGLLAAVHAYGRVDLFLPRVDWLLKRLGPRPARAIGEFRADASNWLDDYVYRMTRGADLRVLFTGIRKVLERFGSLGACFRSGWDGELRPALTRFVNHLRPDPPLRRGVRYLLPDPEGGSACKRLNLFLRWMVRTEFPDLGLWSFVPPKKLIIPLDTHITWMGRALGLTTRKTGNWKTAHEITACLRELDPEDPLRYDFALCHLCISGDCRKEYVEEVCSECVLDGVCMAGRGS